MVSFDVTTLYTNLPIDRTIQSVRGHLEMDDPLGSRTPLSIEEVLRLLEICLRSTFFTFQGSYYCQKDGVAMGSPVSAVVANIFMQSFEKKALSTATKLTPRVWKRYVDDVFSIIWKASVDGFLRHINGTDEQTNFTI